MYYKMEAEAEAEAVEAVLKSTASTSLVLSQVVMVVAFWWLMAVVNREVMMVTMIVAIRNSILDKIYKLLRYVRGDLSRSKKMHYFVMK